MSDDEANISGPETASDPGAAIKTAALAQLAKSESIENYAAERADQEAEAASSQQPRPSSALLATEKLWIWRGRKPTGRVKKRD